MVDNISTWAQGIVVAVIVGTVIEMMIPKGSSSKYIKVVIGVFILFTIISPVISKVSGSEIDINSIIQLDDYDVNSEIQTISNIETEKDNQIMEIYKENLKIDILTKVQLKGYKVGNVNVQIDNNEQYNISKIEVYITEKNSETNDNQQVASIIDNIQSIKINLSNSKDNSKENEKCVLTDSEKKKLKSYLGDIYEISEDKIFIF